jgi:lipopolysaccharide export system permease protein
MFSVGPLSKNNEITAMKALGVNIYKTIFLLIMLGFIVGTCDFVIREFIITKSNKYSEFIKIKKIRKQNIKLVQKFYDLIFSVSRHERIVIYFLNINKKILHNIMIEKYNDKFELINITIAQYGIWNNTRWVLYNGVIRSFNNNNNTLLKETYFKKYISNIIMTPLAMKIVLQDIPYDNMTTRELIKYINLLKFFGQSEMKLRCALIALYIRYAAIFSHIVVVIIGIPFVLQIKNNIFNFTVALLISLTYCWMQTLTNSLGENFILSPFWSTWFANIIFTIFGICLIIKLRKIK